MIIAIKEITESIARGAKICAERNEDPIDPIGHNEDKEVKENDV